MGKYGPGWKILKTPFNRWTLTLFTINFLVLVGGFSWLWINPGWMHPSYTLISLNQSQLKLGMHFVKLPLDPFWSHAFKCNIYWLVLITNTAKFFRSPSNSTTHIQKLVWFFVRRKHSEACYYYVIKFCLSLHISLGQNAENRHFLKSQQIETDYLWSEINAAWQKMSSKMLWWHYLYLHIRGRQHNEKHKHNPVCIWKENIEAHSVSIFPWIFFYGEPLWSVSPFAK